MLKRGTALAARLENEYDDCFRLAAYIAVSAAFMSASVVAPSAGYTAMPILGRTVSARQN
jgi:hypothetical protein